MKKREGVRGEKERTMNREKKKDGQDRGNDVCNKLRETVTGKGRVINKGRREMTEKKDKDT